jgi:hypothetical protein
MALQKIKHMTPQENQTSFDESMGCGCTRNENTYIEIFCTAIGMRGKGVGTVNSQRRGEVCASRKQERHSTTRVRSCGLTHHPLGVQETKT